MKFLRIAAGYTTKDQTINTKIREELNIFNLNAKIIISRLRWRCHVQQMDDRRIPKKILTQPKEKTKHRTPTVTMEESAYSSKERNRPRLA
jgi:hypothetical protein